jgi:YidC/Oxa1 family membrane protein insertase
LLREFFPPCPGGKKALGKDILKLLGLPLIIWGGIMLLGLSRPAVAAPPDLGGKTLGPVAQEAGVRLEKQASSETIALGSPVTYTVTIENEGDEAVSPALVDTLPDEQDGLALQTQSLSATVGIATIEGNTVRWQAELEPGERVVITYAAIPPSTSTPAQELQNVAVVEVGESQLEAAVTITTEAPSLGFWRGFVNFIARALVFFDKGLEAISTPYAFGFAIILFTVVVRLATFPLNMQQIKSAKAMQELQPQMKALQDKYKGDREKLAQAQMQLYKEAGVNPLGGCLPMLVQMPIWIALYNALIQLSHEGLLNEGFFWIPSLAGPVSGWSGGIGWLWPFPPAVGWANAIAYLVMPVLLIVSQFYMQKMMTPPTTDPQQQQMQAIMKWMPLMFGYFSLIVPSGLTLYWFTSNILGMAQQYFTKSQLGSTPIQAGDGRPVHAAAAAAVTLGEDKKEKDDKPKRKSRRKR